MTRAPTASRALTRALKARPLQPWEEPTAQLARRLAHELDHATDPDEIAGYARQLLAVLKALGMTRDKIVIAGAGSAPDEPRPLDQLRARRAGIVDAAPGDPPRP